MKQLLSLIIITLFYCNLQAQNAIDILNGQVQVMACTDSCITMIANYPKPLKTDVYTVSGIPYAPAPFAGTVVNINDDKFTTAIPIGFDFCFFNQVYTQCYLADNGVLTFNSAYSGVSCNNNIQQTLPYFNSTFPDNAVFFLFMDINPSLGGTVKYSTIGTAPLRKFVISYENVRLFGNACTNATSTFQVVLCETTHYIETYINNKAVCNNNAQNYANYATVGIQNMGATSFLTAPGKHASVFTASNEAIRFSPAGVPAYFMEWICDTLMATNTDSLLYCPPRYPFHSVVARITYDCPPGIYTDSAILTKPIPDITGLQLLGPWCASDTGGTILVNAVVNVPPAMYSINYGPFTLNNVFTGLGMGGYTLTVKDGIGCEVDTTVFLSAINFMYLFKDTLINPTCPDSNGKLVVSVIGGTPPYTFVWSNGDIGNVADSLGIGTVYVTVTDSNGCVQVFPETLYFDSLPKIDYVLTKPQCGNSLGSITVTVNNGNPPYDLLWNTGDTTYTVNNLSPNNIYMLTVTDIIGCTGLFSIFLQDTLNTATDSSFAHTSCGINNGSATVVPDSGMPPYTFLWIPGGQTTASVFNLPPGVYTCITSDANNCTEDNTFTILPSLPLINSVSWSDANCDTSNGSIYLNGVQNAPNGFNQLWSNGQTGSSITGLSAGTYWVTTFTGVGGCQQTDTVVLVNDGKPQLYVVSYDPPKCYGEKGSALLGGTAGTPPYKYSIDGITFQSSAHLNYLLAGIYTVYITDANSCINSTTVTFAEPPLITLNYTADTVVCFDDKTATVHFSAGGGTPGYEYQFNNGFFSPDTMFDALQKGIYPLVVRDANNCLRPFNLEVVGPQDELDVIINKKDLYCKEQNTGSFTATITGGWPPYTYTWSNDSTGLSFANLGETKMTIYVTDSMGCETEKYVNIDILGCCQMVMPNAFTPNGDGLNDNLKPIAVSTINSIKFSIYDRWGHLVFRTETAGEKWDGTENGTPCNMGVYFYYVEYMCPQESKKFILKGDVTLIK